MLECKFHWCRWNEQVQSTCNKKSCEASDEDLINFRKWQNEDTVKLVGQFLLDTSKEIHWKPCDDIMENVGDRSKS